MGSAVGRPSLTALVILVVAAERFPCKANWLASCRREHVGTARFQRRSSCAHFCAPSR
jgi:hypothetical protein